MKITNTKQTSFSHIVFSTGKKVSSKAKNLFLRIERDVIYRIRLSSRKISRIFHLNLFLDKNQVSQKELEQILSEFNVLRNNGNTSSISLSKFLNKLGYSSTISNIDFSILDVTIQQAMGPGKTPMMGTEALTNLNFSKITFKNCNFSSVNLSESSFSNVQFIDCDLSESTNIGGAYKNCMFNNCILTNVFYDHSSFENTHFDRCDLTLGNFKSTRLTGTNFTNSNLSKMNFWKSTVINSEISKCIYTDTLFFQTKFRADFFIPREVDKPVVLFLWNARKKGMSAEKIRNEMSSQDLIPFLIDYTLPQIDQNELHQVFDEIPSHQHTENSSIAQSILQNTQNSAVNSIGSMVKEILPHIDVIVMPGGADIDPEFYGQIADETTNTAGCLARSILEFQTLRHANTMGIPLMGICRGAQTANVFYGGKLDQDISGHQYKFQNYKTEQQNGIIAGIIQSETVRSVSAHHQAVSETGKKLEEVITYKGIPKAWEKKAGAPQIFYQFHPEFIKDSSFLSGKYMTSSMSKKNHELFDIIGELGKQKKTQKKTIGIISQTTLLDLKSKNQRYPKPKVHIFKRVMRKFSLKK